MVVALLLRERPLVFAAFFIWRNFLLLELRSTARFHLNQQSLLLGQPDGDASHSFFGVRGKDMAKSSTDTTRDLFSRNLDTYLFPDNGQQRPPLAIAVVPQHNQSIQHID
jgi:hypothetical protein